MLLHSAIRFHLMTTYNTYVCRCVPRSHQTHLSPLNRQRARCIYKASDEPPLCNTRAVPIAAQTLLACIYVWLGTKTSERENEENLNWKVHTYLHSHSALQCLCVSFYTLVYVAVIESGVHVLLNVCACACRTFGKTIIKFFGSISTFVAQPSIASYNDVMIP